MSTGVRLSPNDIVIASLWRNTLWIQVLWSIGKIHIQLPISTSFKTTWISFSASSLPLLTGLIWQLPWCAHSSLFSSDLYSERDVYWFLKTSSSVEWDCLEEKHTWKRRMPQSCIFKTVQRSKNLFFIIKNVFLDGVGSLKCSILKWGHWCLQCTLSWSDHN